MAEIGDGYGSEWHLLRYLGRHRDDLDGRVIAEIAATSVRWRDFLFDPEKPRLDREWEGLDFLPERHPALLAWAQHWPQSGTQQNWDAVGRAKIDGTDEWLLVEAKAHLGELTSRCGAKESGGLPKIRKALENLKRSLGAADDRDWLNGYYQFANRLAVLDFLTQNGIPARLLFIYFLGDKRDGDVRCPKCSEEWQETLSHQDQWLGLKADHRLAKRIHKIFLPVLGTNPVPA